MPKKLLFSNDPATDLVQDEYSGLSGLLCSRIDVANQPEKTGVDFELAPNPQAKVPLWNEFRLRGTYHKIDKTEQGYRAIPETAF